MLHPNLEKLDCLVRVVTPENVEFEYVLAGPFQRVLAFVFDFLVRIAAMFGLLVVLGMSSLVVPFASTLTTISLILLFFLLSWFYGVYFESRFNGRTLGKMLFKLRVISTDGRPINGVQAALRNLLRSADTFPSPITGLICMAVTNRFQRIGDLAAGTMVIVDRVRRAPWDLQPDDPRAFGLAELIPHSFVANYTMTQSIGMYMENRRKLPMSRRLEVARHLAGPLLKQFEMLPDTSPDLLLCAMFVRIFMSEQQQAAGREQLRQSGSRAKPKSMSRPSVDSPASMPLNVPAGAAAPALPRLSDRDLPAAASIATGELAVPASSKPSSHVAAEPVDALAIVAELVPPNGPQIPHETPTLSTLPSDATSTAKNP